MDNVKILEVKQSIFASNDEQAAQLRQSLKEKKIFLLNLMSAPGSGKSTFVETLLHALARRYTPDVLNIYALDCTSRRTAAFAACPQVGAVLDATDLSRVGRLFALLDGLLNERPTRLQGLFYHVRGTSQQ